MKTPTTSATTTTRTAQLQAHLLRNENKGYASERTLRRAMAATLAAIDADGLAGNFELVVVQEGRHAGRVVPVLVFGPRETVPSEAIRHAWAGVLIFSYRH